MHTSAGRGGRVVATPPPPVCCRYAARADRESPPALPPVAVQATLRGGTLTAASPAAARYFGHSPARSRRRPPPGAHPHGPRPAAPQRTPAQGLPLSASMHWARPAIDGGGVAPAATPRARSPRRSDLAAPPHTAQRDRPAMRPQMAAAGGRGRRRPLPTSRTLGPPLWRPRCALARRSWDTPAVAQPPPPHVPRRASPRSLWPTPVHGPHTSHLHPGVGGVGGGERRVARTAG